MSVNIDIMESDIGRQLKSGRVRHKWQSQGQMTNRWASFQKDLSFFLIYIIMLEFLTVFPGHLLHFCSGCLSSNSRCDLIALYYSAQAAVTKITRAEWRKTGIYASQSGGWKSKIKVLSGLVSGEASCWPAGSTVSVCPHLVFPMCTCRHGVSSPSYKDTNPVGSGSQPSDLL